MPGGGLGGGASVGFGGLPLEARAERGLLGLGAGVVGGLGGGRLLTGLLQDAGPIGVGGGHLLGGLGGELLGNGAALGFGAGLDGLFVGACSAASRPLTAWVAAASARAVCWACVAAASSAACRAASAACAASVISLAARSISRRTLRGSFGSWARSPGTAAVAASTCGRAGAGE